MRVLAIDTALDACQAALVEDDRVLAPSRSDPMQRGHQERLAPMVRDVMAAAAVGFETLERIAVTVGPGSFTGLRVGLAFAKGAALALGIPCLGIGTLEALATTAGGGRLAAVIDARRDRCYLQLFNDGVAESPPGLLDIALAQRRLAHAASRRDIRLVGPGAPLLGGAEVTFAVPDPAALARLAARKPGPIAAPAPLYLREVDALTIAERAALG